jgi:hypothetical protein
MPHEPPTEPRREPVVHEKEMAAVASASAVMADLTVKRGLNDTRLAVLGILVGIGLSVGLGVPGPWWVGVLAGLGSFILACALIRWEPSQRRLMAFMYWLTKR